MSAVDQVKEYIQAGDIFQLVLSHRFKRRTFADPFEIYRCAATGSPLYGMMMMIAMLLLLLVVLLLMMMMMM